MIEAHLRKLRARDDVSANEERAIRDLFVETRKIPAHRTLIQEGQELSFSILLLEGWLARTKDVLKGDRQILELHVPGDFADLHSFTLKHLDHNVVALTAAKIAIAPHDRIQHLTEQHPHVGRLFWLMTNIDAAIQRAWTLSLGRKSAISRLANLLCELFERLRIVGLDDGVSLDFPLTQAQLGECLGLTPVHVNRMLQSLRTEGVIMLEKRRLTILAPSRLQAIAEFDPAYLYLSSRRR